MVKYPYTQWTVLIVNGEEIYKGHFDACVRVAGGYPNQHIIIKPK